MVPLTGIALALIAVRALAEPILIPLWVDGDADRLPNLVETYYHHACSGEIALVRLEALSVDLADYGLKGERVVEFSESEILDEWLMPVDSVVLAISGSKIVVTFGTGALAIGRDGSLAQVEVPPHGGQLGSCPEFLSLALGPSAYLRCFTYTDGETGKDRNLGFRAPCT